MVEEKRSLESVKNFIFDIDSTVWYWNELIPGVKNTIRKLKAKGKRVFYLTDNSILSRKGLAEKLSDMGIKTDKEDIITSTYVAARTFSEMGVEKVYAVGEQAMVDELKTQHVQTGESAEHVVTGVDRNFSFWKMAEAADRVRKGADLWTTGLAESFQAGDRILPGTGAITQAIKSASGAEEVKKFGKPSKHMIRVVKDEFPIMPGRTVMIGDNINTDIVVGNKMGIKTGLVLSGKTSKEDLKDLEGIETPNYAFKEFSRILRKV